MLIWPNANFLLRISAFIPSSSIIAEFDKINASIYEFAVSLPSSVHSSLIQFPAIYKCKCDHFGHWRGYVCPSFSKLCHRGLLRYKRNQCCILFLLARTFQPATAQIDVSVTGCPSTGMLNYSRVPCDCDHVELYCNDIMRRCATWPPSVSSAVAWPLNVHRIIAKNDNEPGKLSGETNGNFLDSNYPGFLLKQIRHVADDRLTDVL